MNITYPRHGAVLCHADGREDTDGLTVTVEGTADPLARVEVNGVPARRDASRFSAEVTLRRFKTEIVARATGPRGADSHAVTVLYDRNSFKRYRLFIDDNIFFLEELARTRPRSMFDCEYLGWFRTLHEKYGTRTVLNVFYKNDHPDPGGFVDGHETHFTLDKMPEWFRGEFEDNADWLRLAFHAFSEFPDRPYQYASAEKLADDYDRTAAEIERFAGKATLTWPTVIHWAMVHPDGMPVLRRRGVKVLGGQFVGARTGPGQSDASTLQTDIGYGLDLERSLYLVDRGLLYDDHHDMVFHKGDACCNLLTPDEATRAVRRRIDSTHYNQLIGLASHEQYSFGFYHNYLPDHFQRIEAAVRTAHEAGYTPVFEQDGFLGNPTTAPGFEAWS